MKMKVINSDGAPHPLHTQLKSNTPKANCGDKALAFHFLEPAILQGRWDLVRLVVNTMATERNVLPLSTLHSIAQYAPVPARRHFVRLCLEEGVAIWAMIVWLYLGQWKSIHYIRGLDGLVLKNGDWMRFYEVLTIIREEAFNIPASLKRYGIKPFQWTHLYQFKQIIVDNASMFGMEKLIGDLPKTILTELPSACHSLLALTLSDQTEDHMRKIFKMLTVTGIASMQRRVDVQEGITQFSDGTFLHPAITVLETGNLDLACMFFKSWSVSSEVLFKLKTYKKLQESFDRMEAKGLPSCRTILEDLNSDPWPLEFLAREKLSELIGCGPGRAASIRALPLPEMLKRMVRYEDVVPQSPYIIHWPRALPLPEPLKRKVRYDDSQSPYIVHWPPVESRGVKRKLETC